MKPVLYLFPDTNVFLQCKPLEQTSWEAFGQWERIEVVVTRPVQTEIDALKGNGNGRRAAKARAASSLLRRLLDVDPPVIVLSSSPLVQLTVRLNLRTEASVADSLNYESKDDQLVGTALAFQKAHPESATRLLTDDTGVMFSAKAVGVQYIGIPEEWFLPAELDESAKREKALREQIASYERSEPQFTIALTATHVDSRLAAPESIPPAASSSKKSERASGGISPFKATCTKYVPLSDGEIDALVSRLVERLPQETEFGPTERQERAIDNGALLEAMQGRFKEVFTPASPERIEAYKAAYHGWGEKCRERLQTYHDALNSQVKWPTFVATICNVGSRPADDTFVRIEALGKPRLLRPGTKPAKGDVTLDDRFRLPAPPVAPKGQWEKVQLSKGYDELAKRFGDVASYLHSPEPIRIPSFHLPTPSDPNALYWKDMRPELPQKVRELTCTQWRHAVEPEELHLSLVFPIEPGTHSGQVKVTVHAANLTAPATASLPVAVVVEEASCAGLAAELVEAVKLPKPGFRFNLSTG